MLPPQSHQAVYGPVTISTYIKRIKQTMDINNLIGSIIYWNANLLLTKQRVLYNTLNLSSLDCLHKHKKILH